MKTITIQTVFEVEDEYSRCSDSELIDAISRILNAYFYHDTWISVGETEIVDRDTAEIEPIEKPMDMNEHYYECKCGYDFITEYDSYCGGCGKKLDRKTMAKKQDTVCEYCQTMVEDDCDSCVRNKQFGYKRKEKQVMNNKQYKELTQEVFVGQPKEVICADIRADGTLRLEYSDGDWSYEGGYRYKPNQHLDRKFTSDGMTWDEAKECAENGTLEVCGHLTDVWRPYTMINADTFPSPDCLTYERYRKRPETKHDTTEIRKCPEPLTCSHDACIEARHRKDTAELLDADGQPIQIGKKYMLTSIKKCVIPSEITANYIAFGDTEGKLIAKSSHMLKALADTAEIKEPEFMDTSIEQGLENMNVIIKLVRAFNELRKEVDKKEFKQMSLKK